MHIVINLDLQKLNRLEVIVIGGVGSDCSAIESQLLTATAAAMGVRKGKIAVDSRDERAGHVLRLRVTRGKPSCMGGPADALKAALETAGHTVALNEFNDFTEDQKAAMVKGRGDLKFDTDSLRQRPIDRGTLPE